MHLERLSVSNYKNIRQLEAEFSPSINLFLGQNGMGKTNLLDAIYYLSFCKSHTRTPDPQALCQGENMFFIQGFYFFDPHHEEILCGYKPCEKKVFKRNKKEYQRLSQHIGLLPLVIISPQDTELIHGSSDARRRFMDILISQYNNVYLHSLISYNRALRQRNTLLRTQVDDYRLYTAFEAILIRESKLIFEARKEFIRQLIPLFNHYYGYISNSQETVLFDYLSHLHSEEPSQMLDRHRQTDRRLGYTSAGIHRDDIHFTLRQQSLHYTGSQGQQKTTLLSLKLAQYSLLAQHAPSTPMLLLDDIFDKLDLPRVQQIIDLVSGKDFGQIFITDTNRQHLDTLLRSSAVPTSSFHLVEGELSRLED